MQSELEWLLALPLHRVHLDLVRAPAQLDAALSHDIAAGGLSLGLVDGRNVWRTDLDAALAPARRAADALGPERVTVAASCSLLHVPYNAAREEHLDAEVRSWLAFADEKLDELTALRDAVAEPARADELLAPSRRVRDARRASAWRTTRRSPPGWRRCTPRRRRAGPRSSAATRPRARPLRLPDLPTTTIGSFPQTDELRNARRRHRDGALDDAGYRALLEASVRDAIARQEELGLDVLVHGEPERNDMVEYFGEHLAGFAFTRHGWVQSYGSRCVKPPLIYGDVSRPAAMTVDWWRWPRTPPTARSRACSPGP